MTTIEQVVEANAVEAFGAYGGIREDPIIFFRNALELLGISTRGMVANVLENPFETDYLLSMSLSTHNNKKRELIFHVYLSYSGTGTYPQTGAESKMMPEWLQQGRKTLLPNGNLLRGFELRRHDLQFFGEHAKNMMPSFVLQEVTEDYPYDKYRTLDLHQPQPGFFAVHSYDRNWDHVPAALSPGHAEQDYRPLLDGMVAWFIISYRPKPKANAPQRETLLRPTHGQPAHKNVVDQYIAALFTESEAAGLRQSIDAAVLRLRGSWHSIPTLNLGVKQLPGPNAGSATFIAEGAVLFAEYLGTLGILSPQEAKAVVAQRVANYVMHKTGFQRSAAEARTILNELGR